VPGNTNPALFRFPYLLGVDGSALQGEESRYCADGGFPEGQR